MIYAIYPALAVVVFLIVLNRLGRGVRKIEISGVLSIMLLGLIAASFSIAGWKSGSIAIALTLVCSVVTCPLAAHVGSRVFRLTSGGTKGRYVGLPPKGLGRLSQQLAYHSGDMLNAFDRQNRAEEALLDFCEAQPEIRAVMSEFRVTREDLKGFYAQLVLAGAGQWRCGHWVPASSVAYPESLPYLLVRRNGDGAETAWNLLMYFEQGAPLKT
jgi:hypothetical protein